MVDLYTDGSGCAAGPCGWAYVVVNGSDYAYITKGSGSQVEGTSNIGEMLAVLNGLKCCNEHFPGQLINVYCDSAYVVNAFKDDWFKGWLKRGWKNSRGRKVANREIWEELKTLVDSMNVKWYKIKGHSGIEWNEYVDKLAGKARLECLNGSHSTTVATTVGQ